MEFALVDTGIWYGMFDSRDERHRDAQGKIELLESFYLVMPWPTAYETLRTRFVRNKFALEQFERYLKTPRIIFLDDGPFREAAFELSLQKSLRDGRPLSMVDCLIRLILDDTNTKIDFLATFNISDFADICATRGVEII